MSDFVSKELCKERHDGLSRREAERDELLKENQRRIKSVEEAVIVLTEMVKTQAKRDVFDKILIVSVFIMALAVGGIVLGPDITGKMLGGIK